MKKALFSLLFSLSALVASAQFYGINLEPLCWTTSGGTDSTIYVAWFDAAATTAPTRLHYFNVSGTAVNVSGGQLRAGYCSNYILDSLEANIITTYGNFSAAPDTIPANSASEITIANMGTGTHNIFVDGISVRLVPGETYTWRDFYDRLRGKWVYNPEIIISQGTAGVNSTRKVVTPKN